MVKRIETISFVLILVLFVGIVKARGNKYEDTIPPEILRQYHPAVVTDERPKIVTITQPMIWGLRDQPDQGGDVYIFDFEPGKISTVQNEILKKWISNGQNVLIWGKNELYKYEDVFSEIINVTSSGDIKADPQKKQILAKHPVNIDVSDVRFYIYRHLWPSYFLWLSEYPADTEVVVSASSGILAGRVPLGRGYIYFASVDLDENWDRGTDRHRWELNFKHWMLDLPIPGAAELQIHGEPRESLAEQKDQLLLKNGDTITGKLLTQKFTIKTSYANLSFNIKKIQSILFEGGGQNIDMIMLRDGDKLSGVVGPNAIKIQLEDQQEVEIEKDKIKEIRIWQ